MQKSLLVKVTALALTIVSSSVARGQSEDRRGFIGLGIGPSAPFGNFADASTTNARGGRAFPGYTDTMLNLGYHRGEHWGVAGSMSYSEFVMKNGGDDDWWQVATLMAGPMYTRRLGKKTALDVKTVAGMVALTPVIDNYTTNDQTGAGLGIDARFTLRYDLFKKWAVFADAGMQAANVSFVTTAKTDYRALISGLGIACRPKW